MTALAIGAGGALRLPASIVDDADEVAQRLTVRLSTVRGTLINDTDFGLPYDAWVTDEPGPTRAQILAEIRLQIEADPGVLRVLSITDAGAGTAAAIVARAQVRTPNGVGVIELAGPAYPSEGSRAWYLYRRGV